MLSRMEIKQQAVLVIQTRVIKGYWYDDDFWTGTMHVMSYSVKKYRSQSLLIENVYSRKILLVVSWYTGSAVHL